MKNQWLGLFLLCVITLANCQPAAETATRKRPNILFAISDDQSFPHTGFAGCNWVETPAFDLVASKGVFFKNCYAGSPGCAPSRSALVTGRYHWQNEQAGQHAAGWLKQYVPFVDLIQANGYHTGYTGKGVGPFKYGEDPLRSENAAGKAYNEIKYQAGSESDERFASDIRDVNYFENFKSFLEERTEDQPFFFWYGASEPHRSYEKDSWKRRGKTLDQVQVPAFLPDNEVIRGDLLDYAVEIEWFDLHLMRMIKHLESAGELENTIIIVTADNGMPFPRAKANGYDYGVHVPMAVCYPNGFPGSRVVDDPVSFVDLAPTILELTETSREGMLPISGKSIVNLLQSDKEGVIDQSKGYVLAGRERHSSSRYQNLGYPQRIMRRGPYLYIWNMKPDRWPAGAPQRLIPDRNDGATFPLYGIDSTGIHHSEWAFTDIDAAPTKSWIVEHWDQDPYVQYFEWAVARRPEYELFNVETDPECLQNLAYDREYRGIVEQLEAIMIHELTLSKDPRVAGPDEGLFDTYPRYSPMREFPQPDWAE